MNGGFAWGAGQAYFYVAPQLIASYYFLPQWKLSVSGFTKRSRVEILNGLEITSVFIWRAHALQLGAVTEPKAANRNISLSYGYSF